MSITVREPDRHPKATAPASARAERRKKIREKRKVRDEMHAETPRYVSAGRIQVQLRPSPGVLRECPHCLNEIWKWLIECPKCHAELTPE